MADVIAMECHYPGEADLFNDKAFLVWVSELEVEMKKFEAANGWLPYDLPLAKSTGLNCWHDSYADGDSPLAALESDLENAQY